MNRPYTAMLIPGIISGIAETSRFERQENTDDPRRSAGAKSFKKNKKKRRIAAASKKRNRRYTMTLEQIEQRLSALQAEKDKLTAELEHLKSEQNEVKPWRAEKGETYYHIAQLGKTCKAVEINHFIDNEIHKIGNYYRTKELAEQDARELALRGRVRQLRDALCEGYQFVPEELNYFIYYSHAGKEYQTDYVRICQSIAEVYFDTKEHAQQACDILNKEREDG